MKKYIIFVLIAIVLTGCISHKQAIAHSKTYAYCDTYMFNYITLYETTKMYEQFLYTHNTCSLVGSWRVIGDTLILTNSYCYTYDPFKDYELIVNEDETSTKFLIGDSGKYLKLANDTTQISYEIFKLITHN